MLKTNADKLPIISLTAKVEHPKMKLPGYYVGYDGRGRILCGTGGITYNYAIGDKCCAIPGDHIEPGCSCFNPDERANAALQSLACIGNEARVMTGEAKGSVGYVTGKHGGVDHVMIAFEKAVLEKLSLNDEFLIKARGQGLEIEGAEDVDVFNLDPKLLEAMEVELIGDKLIVKVAKVIPAHLMGSGLGSTTLKSGDYDIMMHDEKENERWGLQDLCFGDIVAIEDHYATYGPDYLKGALTIGVIVHSDSFSSGHGPGVSALMSSKTMLAYKIDEKANLKNYLRFEG